MRSVRIILYSIGMILMKRFRLTSVIGANRIYVQLCKERDYIQVFQSQTRNFGDASIGFVQQKLAFTS